MNVLCEIRRLVCFGAVVVSQLVGVRTFSHTNPQYAVLFLKLLTLQSTLANFGFSQQWSWYMKRCEWVIVQGDTKKTEEIVKDKDQLYETKEVVQSVPLVRYKIILFDMNAKLGKEIWTGNAVGTCDLRDESNDNVLILVV